MSIKIVKLYLVLAVFSTLSINEARCSSQNKNWLSLKIEIVPGSANDMSEGPHWDNATQNLYYVDINSGHILRYCNTENKIYRAKVEGENFASFIIPVEGTTDRFAIGSGRRVKIVQWDGNSEQAEVIKTLFEVEMDDDRYKGNRFNDAKCDSRGRLFAGTMRYRHNAFQYRYGALYKYECGGKVELVIPNVGISNGLAWNDKTKKFYFADTADFDVTEYDYDIETGTIDVNTRKTVLNLRDTPNGNIQTDGVTIDTDGNIYVAAFNGSTVYKTNPSNGEILTKVKIPCFHVTSVAFGGPNLDILFVTTANEGNQPFPCGSMFKISGLKAKGQIMTKIKI